MIYQNGLPARSADLPEVPELKKSFFSVLAREETIQKEVMWISLYTEEISTPFTGTSRKMYIRF